MSLRALRRTLREHASKQKAEVLQRFFKTGPGGYAEGDVFIGVVVPHIRSVARIYQNLGLAEISRLLKSSIHEERLTALLILVSKYSKGSDSDKKRIYGIYLKHTRYINNWDLVDSTAEHIIGHYLAERSKGPLYRLAGSKSLWERRIAILATFHYIKRGQFDDTLEIARGLLGDRHDLIHKAVGWMLREVGKRDLPAEEAFIRRYYGKIPRTTLRYAIERFPAQKRRTVLKGRF